MPCWHTPLYRLPMAFGHTSAVIVVGGYLDLDGLRGYAPQVAWGEPRKKCYLWRKPSKGQE